MYTCWRDGGVYTSANYAREQAQGIAAAASEGLITTRVQPGEWSNVWRVSLEGMRFLDEEGVL